MYASKISSPQLSVSIVVYNSALELLQSTLASLQAAAARVHGAKGVVTHLVVVDNHSEAKYSVQLEKMLGSFAVTDSFSLQLLKLEHNIGFGAGHNRVVENLGSDFHLVLNPDVEMAEDVLLEGITRLQTDTRVALLSPRALGTRGQQEFLCKRYPSVLVLGLRAFAPAFIKNLFQQRLGQYELRDLCAGKVEAVVPLVSGCFMLARTADFRSIGGFDESYFLYFEDFDLSIRMRPRGKLLYLPALEIVHHGGYAGNKGLLHLKLFSRAALRFFRLHGWSWI